MKSKFLELKEKVAKSPWHVKLVVALCVAYLVSPIDLIPDFIPVLGQMDDALVLAFLIKYIEKNS